MNAHLPQPIVSVRDLYVRFHNASKIISAVNGVSLTVI